MTQLLADALRKVGQLSEDEQNAIASQILETLEDGEVWEKMLRKNPAKLRKLAAKADAKTDTKIPGSTETIILKAPPGVTPSPAPSNPEKQLAALPPALQTTPQGASPSPPGDEESVTRSFAKARGTMPFPVAGSLTGKYGAAAQTSGDAGLLAKGITITSRAGAQVVAPFDGIVAFAGPFRGYGQLLIIEHSEGYHTLLAGMGHIDARVGQRVLAGEPVGVMENEGAPALYVELSRDGQPINPLPWLADRAGKNSG